MSRYNRSRNCRNYEFKKENLTSLEQYRFEQFSEVMNHPAMEEILDALCSDLRDSRELSQLKFEMSELWLAINTLGLSDQIQEQLDKRAKELEDDIPF